MSIYEFQKRNLSNDGVFECSYCEAIFQCFISTEETQFCPSCGVRSDQFEELNDANYTEDANVGDGEQ